MLTNTSRSHQTASTADVSPVPLLTEATDRSAIEIMVTTGTDRHPFGRLVDWMDEWCDSHPEAIVMMQRGASRQSRHGRCRELIPHAELCEIFTRASAVVTHAGPLTVMDARAAGRLPIVVPRDPRLREHVDGHQLRFARHLARHRVAEVASAKEELFALIDRALSNPAEFAVINNGDAIEGVQRFGSVADDLLNDAGWPASGSMASF